MIEVYSNMSPTREDYVELRLTRSAIRVMGRPDVGWGVDALVFSRDSRWDSLVEFSRLFRDGERAKAEALLRSLAAQHGLRADPGMAHRRRLWSV